MPLRLDSAMRVRITVTAWVVASSLAPSARVDAQVDTRTAIPAPRPLGPVVARSTQTFQNVLGLTVLRGSVFLNDASSRQVWMLDTSLKSGRTILDSTSGTGSERWYGRTAGLFLRRFRGDSMVFIPVGATGGQAGLIIAADGRIVRIAGMPPEDLVPGCPRGNVDNTGWMTCQVPKPSLPATPPAGLLAPGDSLRGFTQGDSSYIVAIGLTTWDADTIGRLLSVPRATAYVRTGSFNGTRMVQPVESHADQWAIFQDGTLAIARAVDYHLDIIDIHRQVTRGPRAPYEWRRLTDDDKARLLDSLRVFDSTTLARQDSARVATGSGALPISPAMRTPLRLPPDEWPSYWSPFAPATLVTAPHHTLPMAVDEDDRIWVAERVARGADSVRVYGIFNRKGEFPERVRIPATQSLAGFGPGGDVYLTEINAGRLTLVKARYR
jgi:hypothetical protein